MKGPILVTGGSGQVGTGLIAAAPGFGAEIVAPARSELDLTDPAAIERWVAARDWAAVINCAAYTAVDKAESDADAAWALNATAPGLLAGATAARAIPLLHVSTDYVFDGAKDGAYVEDDPVNPLGVYGRSKEAGERAVRAGNPRHIILRTAWVISPWGSNFVKTMLRLGAERERLGVVDDQRGCPTAAADIADVLLTIAGGIDDRWGTFHFVNAGEASWFELARAIFDRMAGEGGTVPAINAIATSDYPTAAPRPVNSRLSTAKIERTFGIRPRHWRAALDDILDVLISVDRRDHR